MFSVQIDQDGIIVEDLEEKFQHYLNVVPSTGRPPLQALVYLITVFHNPTGCTLNEGNILKLSCLNFYTSFMILYSFLY